MPNKKKLMSVVDAAGYAMAPADDFYAVSAEFQPETAMRNGHQSAARAIPQVVHEPSPAMLHLEAWAVWLRDLFGPWWGGRAAA